MRPQKPSPQCNMPMPPPAFCDYVVIQILSRLPVKSVVRFSCVCNSWKSLTTDPYLAKLHLHRSSANANFAHHRLMSVANRWGKDGRAISCSIPSLLENPSSLNPEDLHYPLKGTYWVVGSCNGLICLASVTVAEEFEEYWVCLWNPTTRSTSQKLPSFYKEWQWDMSRFCSLNFGFGYDDVDDAYKVVAVLFNGGAVEDSHRSRVKVYSVGENCWRNIQGFPAVPTQRDNDGACVRGTLNWVAVRNFSTPFDWKSVSIDQLVIVSLDLAKETSRMLLWPHGLDILPIVEPTLAVLSDCLCVCHDYKRKYFVVWQMKEFGDEKSWTQLVNLSYECVGYPLPLCMFENGDVLMASSSISQVLLYRRRDNRIQRSEVPEKINWIHPKLYVESLVLP